jgi:UDP-N-acetylglucosamine acyltransferase
MAIHPTAVVDPQARLGERVDVGPFTVIGPGVEIGEGTRIGAHVNLQGPARIGRDNRIYAFSSLGEGPQDLGYGGEPTRLEIGDGNTIREGATLNRGTVRGGGVTRVGNRNFIMAYVHIAHDCRVGDHVVLVNNTSLAGHVTIEDHAMLSGFTLVSQWVSIGACAFSTMGSAINKHVPPYLLVSGNLARPVNLNMVGLKRQGFDDGEIRSLRGLYKRLFRSRESLDAILAEHADGDAQPPAVRAMLAFIAQHRGSHGGVIR